jgi:plastocyanin
MRAVGLLLAILVLAAAAHGGEVRGRVVDAEGRPLADAFVFAPDLPAAPAPAAAVMDQVGKEFVPHALAVPVGTLVRFPNRDDIHHHVYSFSRSKTFELPLYKGEAAPPVRFDAPGVVKLGCNIHDWMSGVVLVVPNAHVARTDADGRFVLVGLPSGAQRLVVWHERSETAPDATARSVAAGDVEPEFRLAVRPPTVRPPVLGARGMP